VVTTGGKNPASKQSLLKGNVGGVMLPGPKTNSTEKEKLGNKLPGTNELKKTGRDAGLPHNPGGGRKVLEKKREEYLILAVQRPKKGAQSNRPQQGGGFPGACTKISCGEKKEKKKKTPQ